MAKATGLAAEQRRALDRLSKLKELRAFYLAGGSAIALHLGHRRCDAGRSLEPPLVGHPSFLPFRGTDADAMNERSAGRVALRGGERHAGAA